MRKRKGAAGVRRAFPRAIELPIRASSCLVVRHPHGRRGRRGVARGVARPVGDVVDAGVARSVGNRPSSPMDAAWPASANGLPAFGVPSWMIRSTESLPLDVVAGVEAALAVADDVDLVHAPALRGAVDHGPDLDGVVADAVEVAQVEVIVGVDTEAVELRHPDVVPDPTVGQDAVGHDRRPAMDVLCEEKLIDQELAERLKGWMGFRNVLVAGARSPDRVIG